ncbi:MAG: SMC family ATPase [Bacteriovoracaceae bacterium]|nr:SMC family ATPase [Bacteriovoracaceae bacterium]
MRIQKLELENITSFKGRHVIDFSSEIPEDELFAITGPTGSGKSTILTAISLALFGKNYKKSLFSDDFVTLGESKGSISMDFIIHEKKYKATWECRILKKDKTPLKNTIAKRNLFHNGLALDKNAEDVLDLSFDQFCKTVILNQGEFSRFLTSTFSERREILERLYDGESLASLGPDLSQLVRENEQKIENLNIQIKNSLPFDHDEIELAKNETQIINSYLDPLKKHHLDIKLYEKNFLDFIKLIKKKNEFSDHIDKLSQKNLLERETLKLLLSKYHKSEELKNHFESKFNHQSPLLNQAISLKGEINLLKNELKRLEDNLTENKEELDKTNSKLKTTSEKIIEKKNEIQSLIKNHLFDKSTANKIKQAGPLVKSTFDINHDNELFIRNIKFHENHLFKLNLKKEDQDNDLAGLVHNLNELKRDIRCEVKNADNDNFESSVRCESRLLRGKSDILSEKLAKAKNIQIQIEKINNEIKKLVEDKKRLSGIEKSLTEQTFTLKSSIENTSKLLEQNKVLNAKYICLKENLSRTNCIVCNSPVVQTATGPKPEIASLEKQKSNLKKLETELESKNRELWGLRDRLNSTTSNLQNLEHEKTHTLDELQATVGETSDGDIVKNIIKERQGLSDKFDNLEKAINKWSVLSEKKKTIHTNLLTLEDEKKEYEQQINDHRKKIESNRKSIDELTANIVNIFPHYPKDFGEIIRIFQNDEKAHQELQSFETAHQSYLREKCSLLENSSHFTKTIQNTSNEIQQKNNLINEKHHKIMNLCSNDDPEKLLQQLGTQNQKARKEFEQSLMELKQKENDIGNIAASIDTLKNQQDELELEILPLFNNLKNNRTLIHINTPTCFNEEGLLHRQNIFGQALEKISMMNTEIDPATQADEMQLFLEELLVPLKEELEIFINETVIKLSEHNIKIKAFDNKQKELARAKEERDSLSKLLDRQKNLFSVIGTSDFRNYALGLIEKNLLIHTNHELSHLCDSRYEIFQETTKKGHDFYILDHFKGGLPRKVSTLSGGETFLVSLAMALALAEMARGKTQIDSFFIDEGFGNLDMDAIDDTLEILFRVRNRGKQIGVISHIQALTCRIPINISMIKSRLGESSIDITYN